MPSDLPTVDVSVVDPAAAPLILDVREDGEWSAGHIDGATHLPMNTVPANSGQLPTDRPIHVICKAGGRSAQVTAWLCQQGFDAYNVDGGMLAWAVSHKPMVAEGDAEPYIA